MTQKQSGGGAATASKPQNGSSSVSSAGKSQPAKDPGLNPFMAMGAKMSTDVKKRHLKILFWGPTGGGKTEMVLRNFPGVACFDTEGNTDVCVDKKEIPAFLQIKTRDIRKIQAGIQAARKPVYLPTGVLLQTIDIDSGSVLWAEQTDVAAYLAEQRAQRKNQEADTANITQNDWTKAKRPLKRLMLEFSLTSIPFLVMTAREKDLYEGEGDNQRKVGVVPDLVKNSVYDFNLAVHLWQADGKRYYEITKVQGSLGDIFPQGSKGTNFPVDKLLEYAERLQPGPDEDIDQEGEGVNLAAQIASQELSETVSHTKSNLIAIAQKAGFSAADLGAILKGAGFTEFDPSRWDQMVKAVNKRAKADGKQPVAGD